MKLATYKSQNRAGRLMIVSRDLTRAVPSQAADNLQAALDDWANVADKLRAEYDALNAGGGADAVAFAAARCESPLPRAYQWADCSAYVNHVELLRRARGAEMPESFWSDPLIYQGGSDDFLAPTADIPLADEAWGLDLEAEIAVITDDTPQGLSAESAAAHLQLFMLANDISLRALVPPELAKGFGFFQSKPASAFSPVAVCADELGAAWSGGKVGLTVEVSVGDALIGRVNGARDMTFSFPQLLAPRRQNPRPNRRQHHRQRHDFQQNR